MTAQGITGPKTGHEKGERGRGGTLLSPQERFAARPGPLARMVAQGIAPVFHPMLSRIDAGLVKGSLLAHLPDGTTRMLGARAPGFDAEIWLKDWRGLLRLATHGVIGFYQSYEAGEWEAKDKAILFALFSGNARALGNTARSSGPFKWAAKLAHGMKRNDRAGAARNIAAHYDIGNDFYRAWLDHSMTYSSGLDVGQDGLEAAQRRKLDAIGERLGEPESVLEIGCGWGSLAQHLSASGARVTAISLSDEQLSFARANTVPSIDYQRLDYRDVVGTYDAIASVEMVEALGREYWPDYLDCVSRSLKPAGRAAIQYISMADDLFETYANTVDFIQAYVFPGGLLIKSSEFRALAKERGLEWRDEVSFGRDYAETLRLWHERFDRAIDEGRLPSGFDARFVRLWKFYLDYCEGGFRAGNIDVHQVTLVKT